MAQGDVLWHSAKDGWADISGNQRIIDILLNTSNTPYGTSGVTRGLITPTWVLDALKAYDDAGGFAGMAPAEYLDKVSDGREHGPKHTFF